MISCLTDTIGLIGCGTPSPASNLFVNSLPGISFKSVEYLADAEQINFQGVWDDVNIRAQSRLSVMTTKELSKRFKLLTIADSIDIGKDIDTTSTTAAGAFRRGLYFDLDFDYGTSSNYRSSALQSHYIKELYFYSSGVVATNFRFYDVDRNNLLQSITQTLTAGWNTISVNAAYQCRRLFVGVDCTLLTTSKLKIPDNVCCGQSDCGATIQGAYKVLNASTSTLVKGDNSFGLSAVYGVRCKYDNIICNNPDVFYETFWYLLGSELMQERITTERINQFTVNRAEAKELKAFYDLEAEKNLQIAVAGINIDLADCCVECNDTITVNETSVFH